MIQASSTTIDSGRVSAAGKGLRNGGILRHLYRQIAGRNQIIERPR
jgi:hypothetical protein